MAEGGRHHGEEEGNKKGKTHRKELPRSMTLITINSIEIEMYEGGVKTLDSV